MAKYCLVNPSTDLITNIIVWNGTSPFTPASRLIYIFTQGDVIGGAVTSPDIIPPVSVEEGSFDTSPFEELNSQIAYLTDQVTRVDGQAETLADRNNSLRLELNSTSASLTDTLSDLAECEGEPGVSPFGISTASLYEPTNKGWTKPDALVTLEDPANISMRMSLGERRATSLVLWSATDRLNVSLDINFDHEGITFDPKIVHHWFTSSDWNQLGPTAVNTRTNFQPMMLLRDETLVRADQATSQNYLTVLRNTVPTEVICSTRALDSTSNRSAVYYPPGVLSTDILDDALTLQTFRLDRGRNKQIWLDVDVPDDATPGTYTGTIDVIDNAEIIGTFNLSVEVLDVVLEASNMVHGVYYRGKLDPLPSLNDQRKSETQMRADFAFLVERGINALIFYHPTTWINSNTNPSTIDSLFPAQIALYAEYGFLVDRIVVNGFALYGATWSATQARVLNEMGALFRVHNPTLKIDWYMKDEPNGDTLQIETNDGGPVDRIHALDSGLDYVYSTAKLSNDVPTSRASGVYEVPVPNATGISFLYTPAVLAKWDTIVSGYMPLLEAATAWHGASKRILNYNSPQSGTDNHRLWRVNYGVMLWAMDYDGCYVYAFQDAFHSIYNTWDNSSNRDHVLAFPGTNRPITTMAMEGFREGIVDVRWIRTVEALIAAAPDGAAKTAASNYLTSLRTACTVNLALYPDKKRLPDFGFDVEAMRETLIDHVVALS